MIPDSNCLKNFIDCFEERSFNDGLIVLSSVVATIRKGNIRLLHRLRSLYRDKRRPVYYFDDVHHQDISQTGSRYQRPSSCAHWYVEHLHDQCTVIVLSSEDKGDGPSFTQRSVHGKTLDRVQHMKSHEYFTHRWTDEHAIFNLYETAAFRQKELQEGLQNTQKGLLRITAHEIEQGVKTGRLIQGVIEVSQFDPSRATVIPGYHGLDADGTPIRSSIESVVIVEGKEDRNHALHGDEVIVEIYSKVTDNVSTVVEEEDAVLVEDGFGVSTDEMQHAKDNEMFGKVVVILSRTVTDILAIVGKEDEDVLKALGDSDHMLSVICVPYDYRYPKMRLRTRKRSHLIGQRFLVRVIGWEAGSNYPEVHLIRTLGMVGDLTAETDGLLLCNGIVSQEFSKAAIRELPLVVGSGWRPSEKEIESEVKAGRKDLRQYFVVSVDPPGCTDVDDAFHVRELDGDSFELGVHIADVSYFVKNESILDEEAAERCTTVYLVDRRLDMLPAVLSEDAASLLSERPRYAVSVVWRINKSTFEVEDVWFGRTVILSRYQLEYLQAEKILRGSDNLNECGMKSRSDLLYLKHSLMLLSDVAAQRLYTRLQNGAIELDSTEFEFAIDKNSGFPQDVLVKNTLSMMKIVAEIMIMANQEVASMIHTVSPRTSLIRCHAEPAGEKLNRLADFCKSVSPDKNSRLNSLFINPENFGKDLQIACVEIQDKDTQSHLRATANLCLSEAKYVLSGSANSTYHFGLGIPIYTHFTSPIRRYADVIVHRQLLESIQEQGHSISTSGLPDKVDRLNKRQRVAKIAQRECSFLYLLLLLFNNPQIHQVVISELQGSSLKVFVPKYGFHARVNLLKRDFLKEMFGSDANDVLINYQSDSNLPSLKISHGDNQLCYRQNDKVWVMLAAEGSHAHGPTLKVRFLIHDDPRVQSLLQNEPSKITSDLLLSPKIRDKAKKMTLSRTDDEDSNPGKNLPLAEALRRLSLSKSTVSVYHTPNVSFLLEETHPPATSRNGGIKELRQTLLDQVKSLQDKGYVYSLQAQKYPMSSPTYTLWQDRSNKMRKLASDLQRYVHSLAMSNI